ncbi:MAG TPA: thermonuclease family protein [Verrucomicrobiae bacterium]|nr:thermonuclease family protein [Verrucomicrobiae bacterium]
MTTQRKIRLFTSLFVFIATFVYATYAAQPAPTGPAPSAATSTAPLAQATSTHTVVTSTNAFVVRDVDGDTIEARLDGEKDDVKIRFLGVNTPESVDPRKPVECFGKEASKHTKAILEGTRVRLESDPQADEVDKYGRLLRNVILEDGTDFNASLVRDGYAYAYLDFPLNKQRKAQLADLQKEAEAAKRGLWNPDTCNGQK